MSNNTYIRNSEGRTPRQQEAYDLHVAGFSNAEIAKIMGISNRRAWGLLNTEKIAAFQKSPKTRESKARWCRENRLAKRMANPVSNRVLAQIDPPETARQQEAYDLYTLDYSPSEIAKMMGLSSSGAVWSLLHHTRRRKYFGKGKANGTQD